MNRVRMPFLITTYLMGQKTLTIQLNNVTFNNNVSESGFQVGQPYPCATQLHNRVRERSINDYCEDATRRPVFAAHTEVSHVSAEGRLHNPLGVFSHIDLACPKLSYEYWDIRL